MSKHFFKSTNKLFLNEKTGYFQSLIHLPYFIHLKYSINFKFVIDLRVHQGPSPDWRLR